MKIVSKFLIDNSPITSARSVFYFSFVKLVRNQHTDIDIFGGKSKKKKDFCFNHRIPENSQIGSPLVTKHDFHSSTSNVYEPLDD